MKAICYDCVHSLRINKGIFWSCKSFKACDRSTTSNVIMAFEIREILNEQNMDTDQTEMRLYR